MMHRAILGSFERFLGILIENHAGRFPLWLAPRQAVVATITSDADDYAAEAVATLRAAGLRVEADTRNEKINYKVREHSLAKVPVILAVGRKEVEERAVSVRRLGEQGQKVVSLEEAARMLAEEATPPDLAERRGRGRPSPPLPVSRRNTVPLRRGYAGPVSSRKIDGRFSPRNTCRRFQRRRRSGRETTPTFRIETSSIRFAGDTAASVRRDAPTPFRGETCMRRGRAGGGSR